MTGSWPLPAPRRLRAQVEPQSFRLPWAQDWMKVSIGAEPRLSETATREVVEALYRFEQKSVAAAVPRVWLESAD